MSIENEFGFIGWNTTGTSDKVWGYFFRSPPAPRSYNQNYGRSTVTFWAARGKAMQFKAGTYDYDLEKLQVSKLKKGYIKIDMTKLLKIWPTFITEAEAKLMWAILAGDVK
jgi:hypothetical protein